MPDGAPHAVHPAVARIADAIVASLDDLVQAAADAIWQQVPAYASSHDDRLREDVTVHVR